MMRTLQIVVCVFVAALSAVVAGPRAAAANYDPLRGAPRTVKIVDFTIHDAKRNRDIPIRVYLPPTTAPCPLIVFSHGLGGSRENDRYLLGALGAHGYVVVALQHAGSDDAVWKDVPRNQRMQAMKAAATARNLLLRVGDVRAALDQLEQWNGQAGHALCHRIDMRHIGMCGHSFGALTTQAVGGEACFGRKMFTDPRICAAIAYSPSGPRRGDASAAFGQVSIPWMVMTGTRDQTSIGVDVASRMSVYPALPPGDKYELVLDGAQHSAFSDRALPGDAAPRNPNHHRVIVALSLAFWDAYLKGDAAARAWLQDKGPRQVLEAGDRWRCK